MNRFVFRNVVVALWPTCAAVMLGVLVLWQGPVGMAGEGENGAGFRGPKELQKQGFRPLFDGKTLDGWNVKPWHEGHWAARDGMIDYDGKIRGRRCLDASLWTDRDFGDFVLYVEWRLPAKPTMKPQPIVLYNGDFLFLKQLQ